VDFVVHLLKSYGMELTRTGGPNDEGVDAIGLAPVSDVLSDRVGGFVVPARARSAVRPAGAGYRSAERSGALNGSR
jgi:hypothetical protein